MKTAAGKNWIIYNAPWQEYRPLTPNGIDHIITDPPYDVRTHNGGASDKGGEIHSTPITFEPLEDPATIVKPFLEISRRWIVCFCALEQLGRYSAAAGDNWIRAGFWHKRTPTPQFSGDRPAQGGEGIAIIHRSGRKRWNGGGRPGFWSFNTERDKDRFHETQKPLELMVALILDFTDPGDTVWDPFGGSMTTGAACLLLGRRFVGNEINGAYFDRAAERLEAAEKGLTVSAARAGQMPLLELRARADKVTGKDPL